MHRSPFVYLILHRLRTPLSVLVVVYALSVLGFMFIAGEDDQGQVYQMDFFHAFYFVSYMGSTIGFGELPYPFTQAQRLWTLCTIYATVIAWLYTIGALLSLLQSRSFQAHHTRKVFDKAVANLREPFYLICGYGGTGRMMVQALLHQGTACVVIDKDIERIHELDLEHFSIAVPRLQGDCADSDILSRTGITSPLCSGVIAVTRDDEANLKVAIVSKLLNPSVKVYCWAEHSDSGDNMASFGTDHIINPYNTFADYLSTALTSPSRYLLQQWLTAPDTEPQCVAINPPKGRWLLCGYGRFGKAVYKKLLENGLPVTVIENAPDNTHSPAGTIKGRGTEAVTLQQAEIHKAVGIIAGTDHDVNNLSIIITAKQLKPDIFTIARQELPSNRALFQVAGIHLITISNDLIVSQLLAQINTPLTAIFLNLIIQKSEQWCADLVSNLALCDGHSDGHADGLNPHTWVVSVQTDQAQKSRLQKSRARALTARLEQGAETQLRHLLYQHDKNGHKNGHSLNNGDKNSRDKTENNACIALMLKRGDDFILLPEKKLALKLGDQILFAGTADSRRQLNHTLNSKAILHYNITGQHLSADILQILRLANLPGLSSRMKRWLEKLKKKNPLG